MRNIWLSSRGSGSTLDTAKVFGVKRKSLGVVLAMALAVLLLPLNSANATAPQTVTYLSTDSDGGTVPTYPNITQGDTLTVSANTGSLTRAGYTFTGWNDQHDTYYAFGAEYTLALAENVTFSPAWVANPSKTVSYNANGGTGTPPTVQTGPIGSAVTTAPANTFSRSGYTFTGWNTQPGGGGTAAAAATSYTIPGSNTTFYAQWSLNTYTITYDANGGTGSAASETFTVLSPATLDDGSGLTFVGKTFLGWATSAGSGVAVSSPYSTPGDVTLYAIWSGTYTITYNNNGGSGTHATDSFTYGDSATTLFDNTGGIFTRAGYVWSGWTTVADDAGTLITSYSSPANVTVYALWKYTVTYSANGGTGTVPTQVNVARGSGFTVGSGALLSKTGYSFVTWNDGTLGGNYAPTSTYPAASGPVTLNAVWAANFNTVTYALNGGTGTAPTQGNVATDGSFTVATSAGFSRTGYTFTGWNDGSTDVAAGSTYNMGSSNVTLTAQWSHDSNDYSVTYNAGTGGSGDSFTESGTATSYSLHSNTFTKTGWAFTGWNTAANGSGTAYTENQLIDLLSSTTLNLYAQWSHNSYAWSVTYDPNGAPGSAVVDSGTSTSYTVAANPFTYAGRSFTGWSTSPSGPATIQPSDVVDVTSAASVTLYAIWSHNSYNYSFTYDPGTGSGTPYTETGTATSYTVHGNTQPFSKPGYTFDGWSPQDVGYVYDLTDTTTVTLTAQWIHNDQGYSVTYTPGSGVGTPYTDSDSGTSYTVDANTFTKPGYTFTYWQDGVDTYTATQVIDLLEPWTVTLIAQWSHNSYDYAITYDANTGSGSMSQDTGTATSVTLTTHAFTKSGYTFTGWNTAANGSGTSYTENQIIDLLDSLTATMYAQWSANAYTVSYDVNGGTGSPDSQTYVTDGPAVTLHDGTVVTPPVGYYFVGWTTVQNDSDTVITTYSTSANITVYAYYSNTYSIAYDSNTATSADAPGYYANDFYTIGSGPFTVVNDGNLFHKTNYDFIGWSSTAEAPLRYGQVPANRVITITPTQNTTLYALWEHRTRAYTVIFNAGGGTGTMATINGSTDYLTLPVNGFTREGYTFSHWSQTSPTVLTYADQEVIDLTGTFVRTLTAVWTANTYTITYSANGGTGSSDSQTYTSGNAATTLHNTPGVSRTGYTFGGWTTTANVGPAITTWGNTSGQYSNVTVYALWNPITYAIHYDTNTATSGSYADDSYATGDTATVLNDGSVLAKTGYHFVGWTTTLNDSSTVITSYGTEADVTVYALWSPNTYTITYNGNSADSGSQADDHYTTDGAPVTLPVTTGYARGGYTFYGWSTTMNDSSTAITTYSSLADITVYALWAPSTYVIHYDTNTADSGSYADDTYTAGDSATVLNDGSVLAKTGYTFAGWTTTLNDSDTVITTYSNYSDITVYALWTPNTYYIHYDTNTATYGSYEDSTYVTGNDPTILADGSGVSKTGYDFGGWSTTINNPGTVITSYGSLSDITVYAIWTPHTYVITYDANGGVGSSDSQTYTTGDTATALHNTPGVSRPGYNFGGWTTVANDSSTIVTELSPSVDTTVYALWNPGTYIIYYDTDTVTYGGTALGSIDPTSYTTGQVGPTILDPLDQEEPAVWNPGYYFGGWTTVINDSTTVVTSLTGLVEDTTVYAYWLPIYTITYDTTTATSGLLDPDTTEYIATHAATQLYTVNQVNAAVQKTGYTFAGWLTNQFDTSTIVTELSPNSDVTVYAYWVLVTWHITYNNNGGTGTLDPTDRPSGSPATTLRSGAGVSKTGFNFGGWTTVANNPATAITTYAGEADITVYAYWVPQPPANNTGGDVVISSFTVTFNANGGTGTMAPQTSNTAAALTSSAFTRTGFTFAGWSTTPTGAVVYANGASYGFAANITIYAQWTAVPATSSVITYNTQGGSAVPSGTFVAGTTITLPAAPTRAGFTFNGWSLSATGGLLLGATFTPASAGDITVFAQWTAVPVVTSFTVTFDGNGATGGSTAAQTASAATALTINSFVRTGFTFAGWSTSPTGAVAYANGATYAFNASVTLYAQWTAVTVTYTVSFDTQGGSAVAALTYNAGGSITLPSAPTRAGFTFAGWFTSAEGGSALTGATYAPATAGNVTLFAQWTGNKVTVQFDSRGGADIKDRVVSVDTEINLPTPTRGGFRFVAWFTTPSGTPGGLRLSSPYTVTGDVTLYARWISPKPLGFALFLIGDSDIISATGAVAALNRVAATIVAGKLSVVSLTGYFSAEGNLQSNLALAADRAESAKAYLIKRLKTLGYTGVKSWFVNASAKADFVGGPEQDRRVTVFGA